VDADFRRAVKERVREFVEGSACPCIVFSAEGLSYLRHEDELERLREMFATESVEIIMYVRDPHRFLESYTRELTKHARPGVIDMDSFAYIEPDTWLVDFKSRVSAYRQAFGPQSVMVLDYDIETRESGNVIPSFLALPEIVWVDGMGGGMT
jgi:hypothetical protein